MKKKIMVQGNLEKILTDEENHFNWIETQLGLKVLATKDTKANNYKSLSMESDR